MSIAMNVPAEMRRKYLERRKRDVMALSEARERSEYELFVTIGHQLKGNAATFGYDELADLGSRMEQAGQSRDLSEVSSCLSEYREWVQKNFADS